MISQGSMGSWGGKGGQGKAGYEYLLAYKITVPIYDYTVEFCERSGVRGVGEVREVKGFPPLSSKRTFDQMVQAARSGSQNIPEGNQASLENYIYLTGVNLASLEELLKDYLAYARQNRLEVWEKAKVVGEVREGGVVREVGEVWGVIKATPTLPNHPNFPNLPDDPTVAVNLMITLTNQAIYLQKKLKRSLQEKFINEGGSLENLRKQHREKTDNLTAAERLRIREQQWKDENEWIRQVSEKFKEKSKGSMGSQGPEPPLPS